MVTDLRRALRDAVETAPQDGIDVRAVMASGARRVQRRRWVTAAGGGAAGALAIAMAAMLGAGPLRPDRGADVPADRSTGIGRVIALADAGDARLRVLATTRTLHLHADDLGFDRFDGITDDGKVARTRYARQRDVVEFGLMDPLTGTTDWLPALTRRVGETRPLSLARDRLVFLESASAFTAAILVFDREAQQWSRHPVTKPGGTQRLFGFEAALGADDRVYLADFDGYRYRWWSVPLTGGMPALESDLQGKDIAWSGQSAATIDLMGRVIATTESGTRTVSTQRPPGCEASTGFRLGSPRVTFGGPVVVATYACADRAQVVVFDDTDQPILSIEKAHLDVAAAGDRWVVLSGEGHTWVLDATLGQLAPISDEPIVTTAGSAGDLVLWTEPGPDASDSVYDVVYKVGQMTDIVPP